MFLGIYICLPPGSPASCRCELLFIFSLPLHPSSRELLTAAENYWLRFSQEEHFQEEIGLLNTANPISKSSCLVSLCPILDHCGVLRVGGRLEHAKLRYSTRHPAILSGRHKITKLIIHTEHVRLLHAGHTRQFIAELSLSHRWST